MDTNKNPLTLKLNQPFSSANPTLLVSGLVNAGEYHFQLVVTDKAGNSSKPATVSVIIDPPTTFWSKLRNWVTKVMSLISRLFKRI
jgi:hypothetical protein